MTNSSHCDNDVLSTYSGSANLTANWQGNPITVTWYNDDTQYDSNQCTYGGNLTMPSSIPQKTGYTFRGWRVRQICTLSGLNPETNGTHYYGIAMHNDAGWCYDENTVSAENCQNSAFTDLNMYEWKTEFTYGTIYGESRCSSYYDESETATDDDLTSDGSGANCYCKATVYAPNDGNQCNITSPMWVTWGGYRSEYICNKYCAQSCSQILFNNSSHRATFFDVN